MEGLMLFVYILLNAVSFAVVVYGIVNFVLSSRTGSTRRLLGLTISILLAILFVEISVHLANGEGLLAPVLIETMQTFSMDADYSYVIYSGDMFGGNAFDTVLKWYRLLLLSAAPIAGGAVVYDVLAGLSPEFRLFFSRKKKMLVFSQLNEKSLTLAENILNSSNNEAAPAVVFAGCNENIRDNAELWARAEKIKAVCLDESLANCRGLEHSAFSLYFLMNEHTGGSFDDIENILTLRELTEHDTQVWNKDAGCKIICFSNSKESAENIRAINDTYQKRGAPGRASLHIVRDYSQTSCMLLREHPLYEALGTGAENGRPLRVLILGNNRFSREMFCNVFWCGQILNHPLQLTAAYSPENSGSDVPELAVWLDKLNPEILESCTPGDSCLSVNESGDCAPEYASVAFAELDIRHISMQELLETPVEFYRGSGSAVRLKNYDYFIVMDGDDRENAAMADNLRRALQYLNSKSGSCSSKVIAVAAEDDAFAGILDLKYKTLAENSDSAEMPKMYTFGNLSKRFSWSSVSADGYYAGNDSLSIDRNGLIHDLPEFASTMDGIYNDWSRIARDFHLPYKMYSAGCVSEDGMACEGPTVEDRLRYCDAVVSDTALFYSLSWLEHRRWCAFLRTQKFRRPPECCLNSLALAYKNTLALWHPCLVECSPAPDENDMLERVGILRDELNSSRGIEQKSAEAGMYHGLSRMRKADAPDGRNGPSVNAAELYYLLTGSELPSEPRAAEKEWKKLLSEKPEIEKCADERHEGYYNLFSLKNSFSFKI